MTGAEIGAAIMLVFAGFCLGVVIGHALPRGR